MRQPRSVRAVVASLATATASLGLALAGGGAAQAATPVALPAHISAPYFEAYTGGSLSGLASQSGNKYLTMAFLQTASAGSCTPLWDGAASTPVAASTFGSDIASLQAAGGDVIPSFGGYAADDTGTDIADSCTSVSSIAAAYESVVTTYNVSRIDLDTEDLSLTNTAGIDRRNKAVAMVEAWAASTGRTVQFSYTLPSTTSGLGATGVAVLQNAVANGARVNVANIMTFDYYDGATHEMANDTETAANGLFNQLTTLYPSKTTAQKWAMIGITEMPGVDDFGPAETFTTADAATVESWAAGKGIASLSFWALQRDNGGCPGSGASDSCSGISQSTWFFSHAFEAFNSAGGGGGTPSNDFSLTDSPASASTAPGGSVSTTVSTAVTSGSAQSVSLSASGAPAGVTLAFTPASVTAGASSTLKATTSSTTAPGSYPITVTGTAASGTHTAVYTLTVTGTGGTTPGALVNGGLETGSLSPWTCQAGGAVATTPVHTGTHALRVSPTASQTGECDQTITVAPNSSHTLTAWVQGNYAFVGVSGGATASAWASGSGWTKLTVPFTTGASGTVTVYLHGWYAQGDVFGDDFAVS